MDALLEFAFAKLLLSIVAASVAALAEQRWRRAQISYALWLTVIATQLVPMMFQISLGGVTLLSQSKQALRYLLHVDGAAIGSVASRWLTTALPVAVVFAWAAGALFVLVTSVRRVYRFNRLLRTHSRVAPPSAQTLADTISSELGLNYAPVVYSLAGALSPLAWFTGGRVRVVFPEGLLHSLDELQLRMVLAHELAHIRRRDHLVRWLEWAACVLFWWNPVVWVARRHLRAAEEICCDATVLSLAHADSRSYAGTLVAVAEFLSKSPGATTPEFAMPAVGMRVDALANRLCVIVAETSRISTPSWAVVAVRLSAFAMLSFSALHPVASRPLLVHDSARVASAKLRIDAALRNGSLTSDQAQQKLEAIKNKVRNSR